VEFFTGILKVLRKPFPQEESIREFLWIIGGIAVFVTLFLYIFRPFGFEALESGEFLICLGFGTVSFVTSVIYEAIIVGVLKIKGPQAHFTYWKWILYFMGAMLFISMANFLFARIVFFDDMQWEFLPHMVRGTFAIGIFPTIFIGAMALMRQERKYQSIANEINRQAAVTPKDFKDSDATIFDISTNQIRYIEALQNYVKIGHLNADGQLVEQTVRATLKGVLDLSQEDSIVRCHRSFLVNRETITSISGNAQGLLLTLADCDTRIPVSRSYVPVFRDTSVG